MWLFVIGDAFFQKLLYCFSRFNYVRMLTVWEIRDDWLENQLG
jgi:hypothetical protein